MPLLNNGGNIKFSETTRTIWNMQVLFFFIPYPGNLFSKRARMGTYIIFD